MICVYERHHFYAVSGVTSERRLERLYRYFNLLFCLRLNEKLRCQGLLKADQAIMVDHVSSVNGKASFVITINQELRPSIVILAAVEDFLSKRKRHFFKIGSSGSGYSNFRQES